MDSIRKYIKMLLIISGRSGRIPKDVDLILKDYDEKYKAYNTLKEVFDAPLFIYVRALKEYKENHSKEQIVDDDCKPSTPLKDISVRLKSLDE